jgi:hypothetical protein
MRASSTAQKTPCPTASTSRFQVGHNAQHCCWGTCKSDSRKKEDGVKFIAFPKPTKYRTIARAWVQLCGRGGFTESSINRYTYICSKHFPPGADLDYKKNEVCIKPTTFCLNPKMFSLISTHIYCKPS